MLRYLALVEANGRTPLGRALMDLSSVARRGSAVIVITPRDDVLWLPALLHLARQGIQCQVVLLERAGFGGKLPSFGLQEAVQQAGFLCHLVHKGDIRRPEENQERRGFWKFKTTGTGKVVVVDRPEIIGQDEQAIPEQNPGRPVHPL